jgi:hypothetical protein
VNQPPRSLPDPRDVPIDSICMTDPFQVRVKGLDEDHVETLVAECESGLGVLPSVVLAGRQTPDGVVHYVLDGHHEVEAQRRAGRDYVRAVVLDLTDEEAIDLAWDRNRRNAKNLSLDDRIAHFERLRERQPPIPKGELARICGLSRSTIYRLSNDVSRKHPGSGNPIVVYLRRIALDPVGWETADHAAREIRRAIPKNDLDDFVARLGDAALAALAVAEQLGFPH